MRPTLVILAAGAGTRYGGLKQLAPIGPGGETLLEYSVFDAVRAGFERVVLVVRPETEPIFRERLDTGMDRRVSLAYVHQRLNDPPLALDRSLGRVKPWGTGQAVLATESEIDGPFAVINADDFYGAESYAVLFRFLSRAGRRPGMAVVGFKISETLTESGPVSRALLDVGDDGGLRRIVEVLEVWRQDDRVLCRQGKEELILGEDELVSMNMWGFTPHVFPELRSRFSDFLSCTDRAADAEFLLPEVIQSLMCERRLRVEVLRGGGDWCGITFRQDHPRVQAIISLLVDQGRYPKELWV